jgi:hypothetical protein
VQDGIHYIVMEYLEGETLATRLAKGRLPLEQVLRYGAEIAEGLDQAHRTCVVHRDLKPGNIMLTRTGAKLMDFGLAKTAPQILPQSSGVSVTMTSPGISQPLTAEGTVMGTFQYMSPEQVEGKEADARSDIFSFGAVLYEMSTGRRAFEGKSQVTVASAILEKDPEPLAAHQPLAPPALQHVVQAALMKDPNSRWQSAADIARQLRFISTTSSSSATMPVLRRSKKRERFLWSGLVLVLLAAVAWLALAARPHPTVLRATLLPPPDTAFDFVGDFSGPPVLSPDGTRVAFAARGPKERNSIWVRRLDSARAEKLVGTDGAFALFWSADGRFIGFFAESKLRKISASGGPVTVLADAPNARGGTWSKDNMIVYAPDYRDSLWKISAAGGTASRATALDPSKHTTHRWPTFLPDQKHFLFFATNHAGGRREDNGIYLGSLDDSSSRLILASDGSALSPPATCSFTSRTHSWRRNSIPTAAPSPESPSRWPTMSSTIAEHFIPCSLSPKAAFCSMNPVRSMALATRTCSGWIAAEKCCVASRNVPATAASVCRLTASAWPFLWATQKQKSGFLTLNTDREPVLPSTMRLTRCRPGRPTASASPTWRKWDPRSCRVPSCMPGWRTEAGRMRHYFR